MSTNFPTGLDSYSVKVDNVDDVLAQHINDLQDAIEAIEAKVGVDGSTVSSSHDYKLRHLPAQEQNWDAGNYEIRAKTFYSDAPDGTAPFTVVSTTVVSNLNADQVDGLDSDDIVQTSGDQTITGVKTFSSVPVLPSSNPTQDNQAARKAYVDTTVDTAVSNLIADMPTGVTKSADTLNGNRSYYYGKYYYLVIGKDSNGQLKMASGVANSGTQIPLPSGCAEEDCHWIVSIAYSGSAHYASTGVDCYINSNRVCYVRTKDNNWVA